MNTSTLTCPVGGTGVDSTTISAGQLSYHLEAGTVSIRHRWPNAAQKWLPVWANSTVPMPLRPIRTSASKPSSILKHELAHARTLIDAMDAMDNVTVYGPHGNRGRVSTLSFNITNMPADQVGVMLDGPRRVCTRRASLCTSRA